MGDPGEGREASLPRFTNNIAFVVVVVVVIVMVVVVVVVIVVFIVAQVYKLRLGLPSSSLLFAFSASL